MFEVAVGILQEGFQMGGHVMGSVNETVVPLPTSLSMSMEPLWFCTML